MRPRSAGLSAALVSVAAAAALLTGCGGGGGEQSKSATQILTDAGRAASAATSVHLSGVVVAQGQRVPTDLRLSAEGAVGTSTFAGVKVDLVRSGDNLYVRGAQQVLGGFLGAKAAAKIDGHWVAIPTSLPQLQQFVGMTDFRQLVRQTLNPTKPVSKAGTRTVDGRQVVALRGFGTDGSGTLLVAATGSPYPVRLETAEGALTYADWGTPVTVQRPTDVVPLASLTG